MYPTDADGIGGAEASLPVTSARTSAAMTAAGPGLAALIWSAAKDGSTDGAQGWQTAATANGGATTIQGTLNSTASTSFTIQFFSSTTCDPSGYGEGELLEGSTLVATDGGGNASFSVVLPRDLSGRAVTATTTASTIAVGARTSEFSACVPVLP